MLPALCSIALAWQGATTPQVEPPSITLTPDALVVRVAGKEHREPIKMIEEAEDLRTSYRKDETSVSWGADGLKIVKGSYQKVSRLPDVALTPKLFSKEQIIETRSLIEQGSRQKDASSLSGSVRLGDWVYFLLRWTDKEGDNWLEALVSVKLTDAKPVPKLLGRFSGISLSQRATDDRLFAFGESVGVFSVNADGKWGLATYHRKTDEFAFKEYGTGLSDYIPIAGKMFLIAEDSSYGKTVIARIDLNTGSRRNLMESTGDVRLVDRNRPFLAEIQTNLGPALLNMETGCEMSLPPRSAVRRTPFGVLVWPSGKPELASLYSFERFLKLTAVKKTAGT